MEKETTACITGHRPIRLPWGYDETKANCILFKKDLKKVFEGAINFGLSTFLTGMAEGFDMIATEILIDLRKPYKHIKIVAVVPCKRQEERWGFSQQQRYRKILSQCDDVIVLSQNYTPTCMNERNLFMVENSSVCIACWDGKPSGTGNTVRFAKENGVKVKIVNSKTFI